MKTKNLLLALLALAVAALAVVAIAGGGDGSGDSPETASGNTADAAFVSDMIVHHEGAIAMARIAQRRATRPEIEQLADEVVAAQASEISTMRRLRRDLPDAEGGMGMSDAEMGMEMDPAMLEQAEPFERAFIDMMVPHHEGAIAMAEALLERGENAQLREMANEIIRAQTKEIEQMRAWRKKWYGSVAATGETMDDHGH
jgi:uncharacterized protein (DUF305 family)